MKSQCLAVNLLQATRVYEDVFDRSIDVQILRLRRKLERDPSVAASHSDRARHRICVRRSGRAGLTVPSLKTDFGHGFSNDGPDQLPLSLQSACDK